MITINNQEVIIFKALAHPIRLELVKKLARKCHCVCDLNENIDCSQSLISQHLKILRDAGIVTQEKSGVRVNYSISNSNYIALVSMVEDLSQSFESF